MMPVLRQAGAGSLSQVKHNLDLLVSDSEQPLAEPLAL